MSLYCMRMCMCVRVCVIVIVSVCLVVVACVCAGVGVLYEHVSFYASVYVCVHALNELLLLRVCVGINVWNGIGLCVYLP